MDASQKLLRARTGMILNTKTAFYATLMMQKPMVENASIETLQTNGETIEFNPAYLDTLTMGELQGTIAHELMHIYNLHHTRMGGRDLEQWNEACDYAINDILINGGMELPKGALIDPRYKGKSAEAIYDELTKQKQQQQPKPDPNGQQQQQGQQGGGQNQPSPSGQGNQPPSGNGQGQPQKQPQMGIGGVTPSPAKTVSELKEVEAKAKQELAKAMTVAKQMGTLPGGMDRIIEKILQPVVDWREALARFVTEIAHNDYNFSRPNSRFIHTGFILPSLYNVEMGDLVLIVDTSGSLNEVLLNKIGAEMQDIASTFNKSITVIYVDTKVQGIETIEPDETMELSPKGGGGTSFIPAFPYMEKEGINPSAIVYFTDGHCSRYPKEPDSPLMWAVYGNEDFNPPFGEVVHVA